MDAIATLKPVHSAHVSDDPWLSKPATPENIANLLVFLASDMSQEISGAIIPIDHARSTIQHMKAMIWHCVNGVM
jgi:enoyl-[acyl-carrier-protein] reductase (NADH)